MKKILVLLAVSFAFLFSAFPTAHASGWRKCANEGEYCHVSGSQVVRYGNGNRWASQRVRNRVFCGNEVFGDPAPNIEKACYVMSGSSGDDDFGGAGWRWCAHENEMCQFSGGGEVRYGVGNRWAVRTGTNGLFCGNIVFGDPAPNQAKSCFVRSSSFDESEGAGSGWRRCASENGFCRFNGSRTVRYGEGRNWTTRRVSNGVFCSNDVFGDPSPNAVKACYIRDN